MKYEKFPFKMEKQFRLKNWDYSSSGFYFVTICTHNKEKIFGNIIQNQFIKNKIGLMIEKYWLKLPEKFPNIELDIYQIMPDHFHGIIFIKNNFVVGTDPCVRSYSNKNIPSSENKNIRSYSNKNINSNQNINNLSINQAQTHGSVPTINQNTKFGNVGLLGQVIRWFKTMTTNEYIKNIKQNNWPKFQNHLWQSRFHDRIIRSEKEYFTIKQYIKNNPTTKTTDPK